MDLVLSAILSKIDESFNGLAILIGLILFISIILWIYVVKTKKISLRNEEQLKKIHSMVRDIQDELKPNDMITNKEDQSDDAVKELISKISKN